MCSQKHKILILTNIELHYTMLVTFSRFLHLSNTFRKLLEPPEWAVECFIPTNWRDFVQNLAKMCSQKHKILILANIESHYTILVAFSRFLHTQHCQKTSGTTGVSCRVLHPNKMVRFCSYFSKNVLPITQNLRFFESFAALSSKLSLHCT